MLHPGGNDRIYTVTTKSATVEEELRLVQVDARSAS
jgi:hypothetical protein